LGKTEVWFPEGEWFDFFTGLRYTSNYGRKMHICRSLHDYPVFAKAGAIVPMQQSKELTAGNDLEVIVFPGKSNSFSLYEDGGDGSDYQHGAFAKTRLEMHWSSNPVFTIHPAEGDTALVPAVRQWRIGLRGFHRGIRVDGMDGEWDCDTNTLWVTVSVKSGDCVTLHILGDELIHDNCDWMERCDRIIGMSQLPHYDKERLWDRLTGVGAKSVRSLRSRVVSLRGYGIPCGKALVELLTLVDDPFLGNQIP
jgi:hypothetical protein